MASSPGFGIFPSFFFGILRDKRRRRSLCQQILAKSFFLQRRRGGERRRISLCLQNLTKLRTTEASDKGDEDVGEVNGFDESDDVQLEGKKVFVWSRCKNLGKIGRSFVNRE